MSTSDPKSVEQNEKKQDISDPNSKNIQSSLSPPTKQEAEAEADSNRGGQAAQTSAAKKTSLWMKCLNMMRSKGQITKGKSDGGKGSPTAGILEKLNDLIKSDISHISDAAKDLEENDRKIITELLEKLENAYSEIMKKNLTDDEKKAKLLSDLSKDLMKLKLAIPQKYKDRAEKKDPLTNLKFISDNIHGGGPSEMMPRLHKEEVFVASTELKDFEDRYNKLDDRVKLCLLCFSIFPRDAIIKKRLMVQWWVVEGYASDEDVAGDYFAELMEKGFIEAVNNNRSLTVGSCRIHPFNLSALVALAERAKLFNFGGGGEPTQNFSGCFQACLMGEGLISRQDFEEKNKSSAGKGNINTDKPTQNFSGLISYDDSVKKNEEPAGTGKGNSNKPTQDFSGRAGLISYEDSVKKNEEPAGKGNSNNKKVIDDLIKELEKLHLVMNVDEHILEFLDEWFSKMKNLNFLYLGRWKASASHHIEVEDAKFLKKLENMKYLKFLSFQGVSNIISLPDSILELTKLKVLDLRACYNLESIPEKIGSMLKMLTHLDMSECYLLSHMPKTLSELSHLRVLKGFFVGDDPKRNKGCTLGELEKLKCLEKLCIYTKWEKFPVEKNVAELGKLGKLSKLTITWGVSLTDGDSGEEKSDASKIESKLPKNLEKLDLKCFPKSKTPDWLKLKNLEHTKLKKLYIRGGKFSDLGQHQGIGEAENERKWKVEVLRLKYLAKIDMEWRRLHDLFPLLKYLQKVSCPNLTLFPCDAKGVWIKPE